MHFLYKINNHPPLKQLHLINEPQFGQRTIDGCHSNCRLHASQRTQTRRLIVKARSYLIGYVECEMKICKIQFLNN